MSTAKKPRSPKPTAAAPDTAKPSDLPPVSKTERWTTVQLPRQAIHGVPYNPRVITPEARRALERNLSKVGHVGPIVVNRRTMPNGWSKEECGYYILGGHQRIEATDAVEGSRDYSLNVAVVELDPRREREQNVFLNNPGAQGQFSDALADLLVEMRALGTELEDTGFAALDLAMLFPERPELTGLFGVDGDVAPILEDVEAAANAKPERDQPGAIKENRAEFKEATTPRGMEFVIVCDTPEQAEQIAALLDIGPAQRFASATHVLALFPDLDT